MNLTHTQYKKQCIIFEYIAFLLYHSICDIKSRKIYIPICVIFAAVGLIVFVMGSRKQILSLIGGILCGVCLMLLSYFTEEGIGMGDGYVVTAVGIWSGGEKTFAALMGGLFLAAVFGILRVCTGKADGKTEFAFVPFLMSAYVSLVLGNAV